MTTPPDFRPFPKIPRFDREVIITEKIDGTNASVHVTDEGDVFAGSRNRWLTLDQDNFGFARWVHEHETELRDGLGPGTHFGEWWGLGIQRGYDLHERRFSLFNTSRWAETPPPSCCHVVPVILTTKGCYLTTDVPDALTDLKSSGSYAAAGYMNPEGVVLYHVAARQLFKVTFDDGPKG